MFSWELLTIFTATKPGDWYSANLGIKAQNVFNVKNVKRNYVLWKTLINKCSLLNFILYSQNKQCKKQHLKMDCNRIFNEQLRCALRKKCPNTE